MDVLVMLEESPEHSPVLAHVNSVPSPLPPARPPRDVVPLYGAPDAPALARTGSFTLTAWIPASTPATAAASLWSWTARSRRPAGSPKWESSARVRRVSSQAMTSTARSTRSARSVTSSRFPMGVATT